MQKASLVRLVLRRVKECVVRVGERGVEGLCSAVWLKNGE